MSRRAQFPAGIDEHALTAAQGKIDSKILAALDFDLACEFPGHTSGNAECVPDQPASFIVYMSHGLRRDSCEPQYILGCAGRATFIVDHRDDKAKCETCKTEGPLRRFAFVLGPIDPKS